MPAGWTVETLGESRVRFLIGMRWCALWRLVRWPWVAVAFARMLRTDRSAGLERTRLGIRRGGPVVVQEWHSRDQLDRWARGDAVHAAPWRRFRREAGRTADWGVWHEVANCTSPRRRGAGAGPPRSRRARAS